MIGFRGRSASVRSILNEGTNSESKEAISADEEAKQVSKLVERASEATKLGAEQANEAAD